MEKNSLKIEDLIELRQYYRASEIVTPRLMRFLNNPCDIIYTDLETWGKKSLRHHFPYFYITRVSVLCTLPDNKYFCFTRGSDWSNNFQITFIINGNNNIQTIQQNSFPECIRLDKNIYFETDKNNILQTYSGLWSNDECALSSVYYNNFIYIFWKDIVGFDLINRRWHTLIKSDRKFDWCTCILFNSRILAIANEKSDIIVIDPLILSMSTFSVPIWKGIRKTILLAFENAAYLIDFLQGKIWKSGILYYILWCMIIKHFIRIVGIFMLTIHIFIGLT